MIEALDESRDPFGLGWDLPEGHLTLEDEVLIMRYAKGLCVNLGTFRGRSAVIMSYYAEKVITVDCYVDPDFGHSDVVQALSRYPNITPVFGKTVDAAESIDRHTIDTLFVDAGHSLKDVLVDYWAYYPRLKPGAVVIFHDYKHMNGQEKSMDVRGGVRDIMASGSLKHIETEGWCFVGSKK